MQVPSSRAGSVLHTSPGWLLESTALLHVASGYLCLKQFGVKGIVDGKGSALPFPQPSPLLLQPSPRATINNTHSPCSVTKTAAAERLNETGKNCFCKFKYPTFNNINSLPCWSSKARHWWVCLLQFHGGIKRSLAPAFEQMTFEASSSVPLGLLLRAPNSWNRALGIQTCLTCKFLSPEWTPEPPDY